jgi:hypothetical protein
MTELTFDPSIELAQHAAGARQRVVADVIEIGRRLTEKEFDRPPHASTIGWSHNDPSVVRSSLIPNVIPTTLQQRVKAGFFLATRQVSGIIIFRSIAFGSTE